MIPTIIEHTGYKDYAYDIYSHLLNNRIIFLSGEINNYVSNLVISEMLYLDSISNDEISLYINSPGGNVTSGMAIYDTMQFIKSDVRTICVGMAASMAAIILAAGKKGKRNALLNSEVMIHQPLGGAQGQATEIKIQADHILYTKNKLNNILSKLTKQPLEKVKNDTERDYYLTSNEAKKYGIIDSII
ncbi:MAG: ATP-dependent Clp protease proteolytic subunit [Bacilli bacterium]|nr:ATP-dependent Clp protease proteolytic subunit [Bacilli bacterium]